MDSTTLFLHIPKTAGTTFNSILRMQYGNSVYSCPVAFFRDSGLYFRELEPEQRAKYQLIRGHFYYGIHESVPGPCRYVTFIRNPISRIVSYYHYFRGIYVPDHPIAGKAREMSLLEFVKSRFTQELENDQVRRVAGTQPEDAPVTEEIFQRACENLKSFAFSGLTERFDESLMMFWERLGWWLPPVYVRSKVVNKGGRNISEEEREAIAELNQYDLRLYELAKQQFETALAETPHLQQKLNRFRQLNNMARFVLPPAMRAHRLLRETFAPEPPLDVSVPTTKSAIA